MPLVRKLIAAQFPQWADLPITPVDPGGWDNRTFHLGNEFSVRLPSAEAYAPQVEKEQKWLPRLAPHLPVPIPIPVAMGEPAEGYPWRWSVYRWIPGEPSARATIPDLREFAKAVAGFLRALHGIDATGGPAFGPHNFYRGGPPDIYDAETRRAIAALGSAIDARAVGAVWDDALAATWSGRPVWVHGDVAAGNLLVEAGRLSAVIDFGSCGVGDPACDLVMAWTFFGEEGRKAFQEALPFDAGTWARGRGWALWKALIVAAGNPREAASSFRVIEEVLSDARRAGWKSE